MLSTFQQRINNKRKCLHRRMIPRRTRCESRRDGKNMFVCVLCITRRAVKGPPPLEGKQRVHIVFVDYRTVLPLIPSIFSVSYLTAIPRTLLPKVLRSPAVRAASAVASSTLPSPLPLPSGLLPSVSGMCLHCVNSSFPGLLAQPYQRKKSSMMALPGVSSWTRRGMINLCPSQWKRRRGRRKLVLPRRMDTNKLKNTTKERVHFVPSFYDKPALELTFKQVYVS